MGIELRQPSSCDPPGVLDLRYRLVNILQCWRSGSTADYCDPIRLANGEVITDGSVLDGQDGAGECRELVRSYPWGRRFAPFTPAGPINLSADVRMQWILGTLLLLLLLVLVAMVTIDYRLRSLRYTTTVVCWIPALSRRRKRRRALNPQPSNSTAVTTLE